MRPVEIVLLVAFSGCGGDPMGGGEMMPPPDLAGTSETDGSPPRDLAVPPVLLDGNVLSLDGGTGPASLWFTISDRDTGLPVSSRVIFRPVPGAGFADNIFGGMFNLQSPGGSTGATVSPGVLGSTEGVLLQSGLGVVPVPAGTYDLIITRGPEYEAVGMTITIAAGEVRKITAELDRSVDTGGWLSADMHVHVNRSFDSKMPLDRRVISMVSNGVEMIVTTDHNVNTDLAPWIAALGYDADTVGSVVGNEFNFAEGHGGAYPVPYDANHAYGGAPPWTPTCNGMVVGINCEPAAKAFGTMHAKIPGVTVVTVNHPWWPMGDLGYFTNIEWGAGTSHPLPAPLATAGAFDAIELLNGYWTVASAEAALVADWFYLLGQGVKVAAVASSDTHRINWVRAGWPRTWLRLPTDRPGEVTGEMLATAIRKQRAIASTGPFVTFTVDGGEIGDTVKRAGPGQVKVAITVDAPGWIAVDSVRVFVNGVEKHNFKVTPGLRPVFQASFNEPLLVDSWIVVLASGQKPMPGDIVGEYTQVQHGIDMLPWAITNPIYVVLGGQKFRPPGWQGAPMELPLPELRRRGPLEVPVDCEPGAGEEPPLDAPERFLMPHLYQ
ncbi:MAG: hypothetical protein EXR72_14195 [Myxococcales bacterium]|nr:hypothetical protein [Myxococcales bacterium]